MSVDRQDFKKARFIHKSLRSFFHAVEIQTETQSMSSELKRGGSICL